MNKLTINIFLTGVFLFAVPAFSCFAGNSRPIEESGPAFLNEGFRWNIGTHYVNEGPVDPYNYWKTTFLQFYGDSTVNGVNYKKLYRGRENPVRDSKVWYLLREEPDGKVYLSDGTSEKLIFDFNLRAGETMVIKYFDNELAMLLVKVDSIGIFNLADNKTSKALYVTVCNYFNNELDCGSQSYPDIWIPEIGSLKHGIYVPYPYVTAEHYSSPNLLCWYVNDELSYKNASFESCDINTSISEITNQENNVRLYQVDIQYIRIDLKQNQSGILELFDLSGKKVFYKNITDTGEYYFGNPPGIYIYRFTGNDGTIDFGKIVKW